MNVKREQRYIVIKKKDADEFLTDTEMTKLLEILDAINMGRRDDGKNPIQGVVVEHDWPMYEATWTAVLCHAKDASFKEMKEIFEGNQDDLDDIDGGLQALIDAGYSK